MFLGGGPPCPENPWFMCWVWQEVIRNDHWDGYYHYPGSCQGELPTWQSDSKYWASLLNPKYSIKVFAICSHLPRNKNGKIKIQEFIDLPILSEEAFNALDKYKLSI